MEVLPDSLFVLVHVTLYFWFRTHADGSSMASAKPTRAIQVGVTCSTLWLKEFGNVKRNHIQMLT